MVKLKAIPAHLLYGPTMVPDSTCTSAQTPRLWLTLKAFADNASATRTAESITICQTIAVCVPAVSRSVGSPA